MSQPLTLPESIAFSTAKTNDFEALVALRIEAMRESLERVGRFDPARARERFRSGFSPTHTRHIELGGKGIGGAVLAQVFTEADQSGFAIRVGALRESESNRFYSEHEFQLVEQSEFDNYYVRPAKNVL